MAITEPYAGTIPAITNQYTGIASIILMIIGIILFTTGITLKRKILWIIGLILTVICALYLLWMRSAGL